MITRSQTQHSQDENQCPNHSINPNSNKSFDKPPQKPLYSNKEICSSKRTLEQWPSVKQLREQYETLPNNHNKSLEDGVVDGARQLRRRYGSSSRSTYRQQSTSSSRSSLYEQDDVAVVGSDREVGLRLRKMNDRLEMTTLSTLSATHDDGSMQDAVHHREGAASTASTDKDSASVETSKDSEVKEQGVDEIEPTMVQQKEMISSPGTSSDPTDEFEDEAVDSTLKEFTSAFEGCRLKSNQTVADDEALVEEVGVVDEDVVGSKTESTCIQLQEETRNDRCLSECKKEIVQSNSSAEETVQSIKAEGRAKEILIYSSQLALMALTLFGMHHRNAQTQMTLSHNRTNDNIASPLWLELLLVFALFVKALYKSTEAALGKESWMLKATCFLRHLIIWTVTIPLFRKSSFSADNICFLTTKTSRHMKLTSPVAACVPSYSLFDVAVSSSYHALLSLLKSIIKGRLLNQVWREIQRALFNPFKFHARVQKALVILKWAKFVGPLIGTCNKFRGNLLDMARKRRQHRVSKAALKRWYDVVDALSKQSKSEQAVIQLQKAFRERRVEKTRKRQLLMANRRWVRSKLEEEERLTRSKLEEIERRDIDRQQRRHVSPEERHGIVQLKKSARILMKRAVLINPKTHFSVIWKYSTVSCVALEVMTILFAPVLSGDVKKMPLDQFVVKVLLGSQSQKDKRMQSAERSITDITCSASPTKLSWFTTAHVVAKILVPVVNCICFLDVFITFFTGELNSNGTLEPKPFFQRWILPGPVLQLLVNPTMIFIKQALMNAFVLVIKIGPSLCLHCFLACGVFVGYLYDKLFDLFLDFVEKINDFNSQTKGQEEDDALHWM